MAILTKKIGFTINIDEEAIAPQSVNVFIYRLLMGLNNENPITSVTIDDVTVPIVKDDDLYNLPLGEDQDLKANPKK